MALLVLDPPTGASTNRSDARILTGEITAPGGMVSAFAAVFGLGGGADVIPAEQHRDITFEREKRAFVALSPFALAPYRGQYVVSRGGTIIDSDRDLSALADRVFRQYGDVPVYITRVGHDAGDVRFDTPFFE